MATPRYRFDITKLYAHIFFDLSNLQGSFGIAVYSLPKVPGFSGEPSQLLEQFRPGFKNANELFRTMIQEEDFIPKGIGEPAINKLLHEGKIFLYAEIGQDVKAKLKKFQQAGAMQVEKPDADVVVNLDNPMLWAGVGNKAFASEEEARAYGEEIKNKLFEGELVSPYKKYIQSIREYASERNPQTEANLKSSYQELENVFLKFYAAVSGITNPKYRNKAYTGRSHPPTLIFSDKYQLVYYPGYKGAQYMTQKPSAKKVHVHKEEATEEGKVWYKVLIDNVSKHVDAMNIKESTLDYITDVCSKSFFKELHKSSSAQNDLRHEDFLRAAEVCKQKAEEMLTNLSDDNFKRPIKKVEASTKMIGTWIDLETGETFETLGEFLSSVSDVIAPPSAKKEKPQMGEEGFQIAAHLKRGK